MKELFDTSVLVAAFGRGHPDHEVSLKLVSAATPKTSFCALHAMAEVYATMTALPVKDVIPTDQALLFVQEVRDRFTVVTLDPDEYYSTIQRAAENGFASGRIYDALLLR
jgi:predicted nucleic acid-binding protein